jgi:phosphoribosylformylglycinamidine synthase subunit PurQ / glutaminase
VKFGIVTFPGSNCDYDAYHAVADNLGETAEYLWHKDHDLKGSDVIILPGGFSYGDYLRAGAIARFSPIMNEVVAHARRGGPVLAVCNGFQIACEAGLLPGALMRNESLRFISDWVRLRVENADTIFTSRYEVGQVIRIPIAHGEGRYTAPDDVLDELEAGGRVVVRYVNEAGEPVASANPNGSMRNIAGIVNEKGNVLGLMPHPERAVDCLLGSDDGLAMFESLLSMANA